jgi:hypothetical protein
MLRSWFALFLPSVLLVTGACRATLPSQLPRENGWIVAVKSCRLSFDGAWYKGLAHHAWIDIHKAGDPKWLRIECAGSVFGVLFSDLDAEEARLDHRFDGHTVHLLGWLDGEAAHRAALAIEARAHELDAFYGENYRLWPGPNSNTFVAEVARAAPDLGFVFDPNCIGKDYPGWIDVGLTASKTGVRLDTVPIGVAVGLREGVEVHMLGLTAGITLDPPGISLPFLPTIPWGFLPGAKADLRAPELEGALRVSIDGALGGARMMLGEISSPGTVIFEHADGSGWLQLDFTLGAWLTKRSRTVEVRRTRHGPEGVDQGSDNLTLDSSAPPDGHLYRCGESYGMLEFEQGVGDKIRISARWNRDLAALRAAK